MLDSPSHAAKESQQFLDFWQSLRVGEGLPRKSDLRPSEIKPLLPLMSVLECFPDQSIARFRLTGTAVEERFGKNLAGHEMFLGNTGPQARGLSPMLYWAITTPCGYRVVLEETYRGAKRCVVEILSLPFANDAGEARYVVSVSKVIAEYFSERSHERGFDAQHVHEYDFLDVGFGVPEDFSLETKELSFNR